MQAGTSRRDRGNRILNPDSEHMGTGHWIHHMSGVLQFVTGLLPVCDKKAIL